jgi:hypothetical protein
VTLKYVLPCPCGAETAVEPRQAGETIQCSCGSTLQIPTMREIIALETAPLESASSQPPAAAWGMSHRLILLGTTVSVLAIAVGIVLYVHRPVSRFGGIDPEEIRRSAQQMSPWYAWEVWETMKQGLDRRTDRQYEMGLVYFRVWEGVVAVAALIGIALIIAGVVTARGRASVKSG